MQFEPKQTEREHNYGETSYFRDVMLLFGGFVTLVLTLYIVSGFTIDIFVDALSVQNEDKLTKLLNYKKYIPSDQTPEEREIQQILNKLVVNSSQSHKEFTLKILKGNVTNAYAEMSRQISIFDHFLKKAETNQEIAMILGHELGHFHYRHHLKGLGRTIVILGVSTLLLGVDSSITEMILKTIEVAQLKYNQKQETLCDEYGLKLLYKTYGSTEGATKFLELIQKEASAFESLFFYMSSHPHPKEREAHLKRMIENEQYR